MDPDLGALLSRVLDAIVERESPILREHELTMWEYVVLTAVGDAPGSNQTELAERSRRDPTRLLAHLDRLAARGLVTRAVDERDRRRRTVRLTAAGEELLRATRLAIRDMERDLLDPLTREQQESLRSALLRIAPERVPSPDPSPTLPG